MDYRNYDPKKDKEATQRIWQETGWLEQGKKEHEECMDLMVNAGRALVVDLQGEPECLVITAAGTKRYLNESLPLSACTGVTTSRIARKQGLAKRLTAQAVALDATDGALVASLSMFEQGYYDQIGFGTCDYERWMSFDPALLNVHVRPRLPQRLKVDQYEIIHAARHKRLLGHGAVNILPAAITKADMIWASNGFGMGYFDGPQGELTHCFWAGTKSVESGPYEIQFMIFRTGPQFLELMALIKSMGDQVRLVRMREPRDIQLQDLVIQPFKQRQITRESAYEVVTRSAAYYQARICDLKGCLARTSLHGNTVRFNLALSDPIAAHLDVDSPWRGVAGDYVVTLGVSSGAESGRDAALPTLKASVNAFTRMWLGVRPASGLAVTDELSGPADLLEQLDWALRLPDAKPDWDF